MPKKKSAHRHPHPPPPPPPRSGRLPDLDRTAIDRALARAVPDPKDRAFVLRCILEEGPRHHRVASWALLQALAALVAERGEVIEPGHVPAVAVPMRLPPNVASGADDTAFPIGIPTRLLARSLEDDEDDVEVAVAALADGPPHHALANAAMLWLMEMLAGEGG